MRACCHQFAANWTRGLFDCPGNWSGYQRSGMLPGRTWSPDLAVDGGRTRWATESRRRPRAPADTRALAIEAELRSVRVRCHRRSRAVTADGQSSLEGPRWGRTRQHREAWVLDVVSRSADATDRTVDGAGVAFADLRLDAASAMSGATRTMGS